MKRITLSLFSLMIALITMADERGPKYASIETKEVIQKMIEAHGGYEKWKALKTLSFMTTMHSESLGVLRFWINDQTVDMQNRRTYQDWPVVGSKLSYDGKKVWSEDWRVGNPPSHQHSVFFYYLNLPWLTQDDHVILGETELIKHPAFDNEVHKVKMSFKKAPTLGKSAKDTYTLYIDSQSYLLVGYEYTIGYGPLLDVVGAPKDQEVFGPVLRKNNYIGEVNGLKFAMLFTTHAADLSAQYGDHVIYDFRIDEGFDESRMIQPANAVIDPAEDVRKN
ncbi:MAG: hypothetical protein R8G66_01425 [Cytophagales bacterium]|nr:hypothetical protein [Cytophagales bacterium]